MSTLKSVIITLPKSLTKAPGCVSTGELRANGTVADAANLNFATSILAARNTNRMERKPAMKVLEETIPMDTDLAKPPDMWLRGKKRRLDHLTWEEKLQRKKLKNRVAAQTSRDRKKAKLDELEDTVKALRDSNDLLSQECAMLRSQNESLLTESKRLRRERDEAKATTTTTTTTTTDNEERFCSACQARVGSAAPTLGSAVSPINPLPQGGAAQPAPSPTALSTNASIILKIMTLYLLSRNSSANSKATTTSSDSRNSPKAFCEKLPQKWKQVLITIKQDTIEESNDTEGMVGPASENVEAGAAVESLSYPRNFAVASPGKAIPSLPINCTRTKSVANAVQRKSAQAARGDAAAATNLPFKREIEVKEEPANDMDTVYGTYDEATNCITIIYPGEDDGVRIQECVQEISSSNNGNCENSTTDDTSSYKPSHILAPKTHINSSYLLSPAYTFTDSISSPSSIHSDDSDAGIANSYKLDSNLSDCGYESHDSPIQTHDKGSTVRSGNANIAGTANNGALTDLWHESFSELFPSLA